MKPFLLILLLAVAAVAQTRTMTVPYGNGLYFPTEDPELRYSFWTQTFDWHNGPPEAIDYKDHTFGFGFNVDRAGVKVIQNRMSMTFSVEDQYRNGEPGEPGAFMSEFHFNICTPYNAVCVRPFGWDVQHDTGNVDWSFQGDWRLFRHASRGGAMSVLWHENGSLDLSMAADGSILFANNTPGNRWRVNSLEYNTVNPAYVDDQNQYRIGGGLNTVVDSPHMIYAVPQCGPIPDVNGEKDDTARALNQLLQCLRESKYLAS